MPARRLSNDWIEALSMDYCFFDDSINDLSTMYQIPESSIRYFVAKGISLGSISKEQFQGAKKRRKSEIQRKVPIEKIRDICQDYTLQNDSPSEIAMKFGVSRLRISRLLSDGINEGLMTRESYEEAKKAQRSLGHRGIIASDETKRKMSEAQKGERNHFYGKKQSDKTKQKLSQVLGGENNPRFEKKHSIETRKRISEANINNQSGAKAAEAIRKSSYNIEDRFYTQSQQEGATALLLEKYVPGFEITEEKNFQVRDKGISNGGLDFLVDGEFLEWHPMVLYNGKRGDIPTPEVAKAVKSILAYLSKTDPESKRGYRDFYKGELGKDYLATRQTAVDNSGYAGTQVSLATNEQELYDFIQRHGRDLPSHAAFKKEFKDAVKYVKSFAVQKGKSTEKAEEIA